MMYKETLEKKIDEVMNSKGYCKTQRKERLAKILLEGSGVLNTWFKDYKALEWQTDKDIQLSGTDYYLTTKKGSIISIDLKAGIGRDYKRIAVEYMQGDPEIDYWVRTFTNDKETDFLLFTNISIEDEKVYFILVDFRFIIDQMDRLENGEKTLFDTVYPNTSFNGTGKYFTIDLEKCRECRSMLIEEFTFDSLTKHHKTSKDPLEGLLELI